MEPFRPAQKKARSSETAVAVELEASSAAPQGNDHPDAALGGKPNYYADFFSTSGCPYREGCPFLHFAPGGLNALSLSTGVENVKNEFPSTGQVDPSVPVNGYKTRLCNRYNTPEGCRFGEKCHFAHGESDLRPAKAANGVPSGANVGQTIAFTDGYAMYPYHPLATSLYYGEPTPPGVTAITSSIMPTSATKISIDASLAGAIIGRAGANVRQLSRLTGAKISVREHETDPRMKNIEMEGLPDQIECASEMIRQFLQSRAETAVSPASILGSHNYKTKLCENFLQGTCTFADQCFFAHGTGELCMTATI